MSSRRAKARGCEHPPRELGPSRRAGPALGARRSAWRAARFPVHGILQPLDQPLQVSDSRLEPGDAIILFIDCRASVRCVSAGRRAAYLADSCNQSLALTHDHRLPDRFGGALRGGYRRRSSAVMRRITSTPLCTCSWMRSSLAWRFSSALSRVVFTGTSHFPTGDTEHDPGAPTLARSGGIHAIPSWAGATAEGRFAASAEKNLTEYRCTRIYHGST